MALKRILGAALVCVGLPSLLSAQGGAGGLVVGSNPEGAQVIVTGSVIVSGVTPATFRHNLIGDYKLELKKYGYENYRTRVVLDPSKTTEINVRLAPKTRLKAAARSLFIPGWGQRYADQRFKGFLFSVLAVGSVAGYLLADDDFDDKLGRYDNLLADYDRTSRHGTYDELKKLQGELDKAQATAYDAENVRRAMIGSVIAVWTLNVLDAVFFFPEERGVFSVKGLTVSPEAEPGSVGITVGMKF